MIQKGGMNTREMKKFTREVNLAEASMGLLPEYLDWSTQSITFSQADHPPSVPRVGHAALVIETQIGAFNMSKVFMDGGSGLNLLFASTLRAMGIATGALSSLDTAFHGIIPTEPAYPLSKISLMVVFEEPRNFRKEHL